MNIKELKDKIKDLPDNMDVMIEQNNDEFRYSLAEVADVFSVVFNANNINKKNGSAIVDCLIIQD